MSVSVNKGFVIVKVDLFSNVKLANVIMPHDRNIFTLFRVHVWTIKGITHSKSNFWTEILQLEY